MASIEEMITYNIAYRLGHPKISDQEWDKLVIETGYKETIGDSLLMNSLNGRIKVPMKTPLTSF